MKITHSKLIKAGFLEGTDMGDGRKEYYVQREDAKFWLWVDNGVYSIDLKWEGYGEPFTITFKTWEQLAATFLLFTNVEI